MFGDSGAPYGAYGDELEKYFNKGIDYQNPFYQAGTGAIPKYQDWLNKMQNPGDFINKTMEGYQESPWAKNMQDYAQRAGTNAASANGMIGSTPFANQMQQNAAGISSQDMQNWLGQVLGINSQYGQGQGNLMAGGQNAGNMISQMLGQLGRGKGQAAFGQEYGNQFDFGNMLGGLGGMFGSFFV
jgi:hypothetical protein